MKTFALCLLLHVSLLALPSPSKANQSDNLHKFIMSRRSKNPSLVLSWTEMDASKGYSSAYVAPQEGLMQADKVAAMPGQPDGVNFDQYAGYVTVDPKAGRALSYYFVESPQNSSTKPLVLWLNGGSGCSSLGIGAMEELGPFRVNSDGKTLFWNEYAWNNVANVLFLESPVGVGFSYSNTSSENYRSGDRTTANDAYIFLINWLERFPQYKSKDFFITGESYSGHYVPQLAYTILLNNNFRNQTVINLKGIAIGNAWIDDPTNYKGLFDYFWSHALNSDETHEAINKYCDFYTANVSIECINSTDKALLEKGNIDFYNIYAPLCHDPSLKNGSTGSVHDFNPCSDFYVQAYLNNPEVQIALHAKPTNWSACRTYNWTDSPSTILPIIKNLTESGIRVWIYSGDTDGRVPVTSTRYSINTLKLPIQVAWHPWYSGNEVGGYVVAYKGVTFVTVREAGHQVPSWQPERALTMITSFLNGTLPPSSPWPAANPPPLFRN